MNLSSNYKKMNIRLNKKNDSYTLEIEFKKKCYEYKGDKSEVLNQASKVFSSDKISYLSGLIDKLDNLENKA